MNLAELHTGEKEVSVGSLFKGELGMVAAIQLKTDAILKEHISKTPAVLLCVSGGVCYEDESGQKIELSQGDYINITPQVKHWLVAHMHSQLLLLK